MLLKKNIIIIRYLFIEKKEGISFSVLFNFKLLFFLRRRLFAAKFEIFQKLD
jgi:hypothetical protein